MIDDEESANYCPMETCRTCRATIYPDQAPVCQDCIDNEEERRQELIEVKKRELLDAVNRIGS